MKTLRFLLAAAVVVLAGCANVAKVSTGDALVDGRLQLNLDAAWNQVNLPGVSRPLLWTQDGITVDALQLWFNISDGQTLIDLPKTQRPLVFKATMTPHEIVSLFEGFHARDGSTFKLERLAPAQFLGSPGVRFDYTVVRKSDDVRVSGVGWAVVRQGELLAIVFVAPRLGFFPRHIDKVEHIAATARMR